MKPISLVANSISTPLQLLSSKSAELRRESAMKNPSRSFQYKKKRDESQNVTHTPLELLTETVKFFFRRFFDQTSAHVLFFHFILFYFITARNVSRHEI